MKIENDTRHAAGMSVFFDKRGEERLVVAVKGTWILRERREPELAEKPDEILVVDECYGEPGRSSVRYEADLAPPKLATDVALVGSAFAPSNDTREMQVALRVGSLHKTARVVGERHWLFGFAGFWFASRVRPFRKVPLIWELAAGGSDDSPQREKHRSLDLRNPLGRGFRSRRSRLAKRGALLPQIEASGRRRRRQPVGFGFIGPNWEPRRRYIGTYDERWRDERCPLLPTDFDERFFNAAAPGLIANGHLRGNEPVEVVGCTPSGRLAFRLPSGRPEVRAEFGRKDSEAIELRLDTVTIDTDAMKLFLLWRGSLVLRGRLQRFERLCVSPAGGTV